MFWGLRGVIERWHPHFITTNPAKMSNNHRKLIASAKPGVHEVKVYKHRKVRTYIYARVRKATFVEIPTHKAFISAIFRLAHDRLNSEQEAE